MAMLAPCGLTELASSAASHSEARQNEIHHGQWQDTLRFICLFVVRETDFERLPAGDRDAAHLLQSRLLRRSLR
jgi:hypothetical protein